MFQNVASISARDLADSQHLLGNVRLEVEKTLRIIKSLFGEPVPLVKDRKIVLPLITGESSNSFAVVDSSKYLEPTFNETKYKTAKLVVGSKKFSARKLVDLYYFINKFLLKDVMTLVEFIDLPFNYTSHLILDEKKLVDFF